VKAIFLFLCFFSFNTAFCSRSSSKNGIFFLSEMQRSSKNNAQKPPETGPDLNEKKFKYTFYPLGVGQYQNEHFLKAKFFMVTQSLAAATFLLSPIVTGSFTDSVGMYSLYTLGGLYLLSLIDGMLFYSPGDSPVQPIFSKNLSGIKFTWNF